MKRIKNLHMIGYIFPDIRQARKSAMDHGEGLHGFTMIYAGIFLIVFEIFGPIE